MTMLTPALLERAHRAARDGRQFRLVQRARLALANRDDAHAARFALEDALNTADFGDAGRLIIVRSLQVTGIHARTSAHVLARSLENAWRHTASHAVSADNPRASDANVVWFSSPFGAKIAWLKRILHGTPVTDWYWRSAVPEALEEPSPATVAAVLLSARDVAPHALADELQSWSASTVARLIARLPDPPRRPTTRATGAPVMKSPARASGTVPAARGSEKRIAWLRELGAAADGDTLNSPDELPPAPRTSPQHVKNGHERAHRAARRDTQARHEREPRTAPDGESSTDGTSEVRRAPVPRIDSPVEARSNAGSRTDRAPANAERAYGTDDSGAPVKPTRAEIDPLSAWPWWTALQPTAHGGLLMLIHVLDALGFGAWLEDQPRDLRKSLLSRLFSLLADIARVPEDDPQRALFANADAVAEHGCAWSSERWPDFLGWRAPPAQMSERRALRLWYTMVRRAIRRTTGFTLVRLVRRDAQVALTRTHADVVFPLDAVDLQLRRYGLDSDPGWVPWLARIVAFHYADQLIPLSVPSRSRATDGC